MRHDMNARIRSALRSSRVLMLALATGAAMTGMAAAAVAPAPQQNFASADDAVTALVTALKADDMKAASSIIGPGADKLLVSGDPVADRNGRQGFLDSYAARHSLTAQGQGRMVLTIGQNDWPLPIPVVLADGRWHFDASAGAQEIINRRIGRNELLTIRTLLAVVEAQADYFDRSKRGLGTGTYAARVASTPGKEDGLYWEVTEGEPPSPLGPLNQQVQDEGYPGATGTKGGQIPYHGYFYRMLKAQGPHAPGGAKDYVRNGKMTEGFAMVAWPADYENSGIVTFLVDQDGVVFQKDLGPNTERLAGAMTRFDPDATWARVDISND